MQLHEIDPLSDSRWADLVERCDLSSVFHTPQWLDALRRTYGYQPVAFTDAPAGEPLKNGLLFCRVRSWMTGRRLVSLPFSDHCEPLVEGGETLHRIVELLKPLMRREGRYTELRPLTSVLTIDGFSRAAVYCHHAIDLRADLQTVYAGFHKNHVQRTIRKALRMGVAVEVGRSSALLTDFYALHRLTRRRHGLPVQPLSWFQNLLISLGDRTSIFMARHEGLPIASILTTRHKKTLVYKYGCSNAAKHRFGGPSLLFWTAIQRAKEQDLVEFDLGRSDWDDLGLLAYKDHLGARRTTLNYYRYTPAAFGLNDARWWSRFEWAYSLAPRVLQTRVGSGLYRHFG
jgi:CelD/BcsL family acetyltransferase involved in cellulose biosynthesis